MIEEVKIFGKNLIATITPTSLATNDVHPLDINGVYDWNAQKYNYDVCNFGTSYSTKIKTCGGGDVSTDSNPD